MDGGIMSSVKFEFCGFRLDPANAILRRGAEPLPLALKPFKVLCLLVQRRGELVTKEEFFEAVWPDIYVTEASLSVAVRAIRVALGDVAVAPRYIQTVARRGYRFIAPVTVVQPEHDDPLSIGVSAFPKATRMRSRWRVGRTEPLANLERLYQQASIGIKQVAFITGEAGIGKTTFIEMALERITRFGVGVWWSSCIEHFGTAEAFLPLIETLQALCRSADGPFILTLLRKHAPTWLAQMPGFVDANDRSALQIEVFGATRERMIREFCDLAEVLSAHRPWVIILEDLHWSDFATLDVLSRLARRDCRAAVLILATYRPTDVSTGGHPIRALHRDLQIHGLSKEILLDRLSQTEVRQYLSLRFEDSEIAPALAGHFFGRTYGQPLFVVSLVDYFVAQGAIIETDGKWRLQPQKGIDQDGMPQDLQELITCQIDHLKTEEQELLEAASAAGAEFSSTVVAWAVGDDAEEVELKLETLARKGQILRSADVTEWPDGTVSGCYAFQHSLFQEVLYRRLPPKKRIRIHRRLGERLEAGYGDQTADIASLLGVHFEEGRDFPKAVLYLAKAAESASKRFGNQEAANYLTRALNLANRFPADEQIIIKLQLLWQRGRVLRAAGKIEAAIDDLRAVVSSAVEAKDPASEVKALVTLSQFYTYVDRRRCLEFADLALERSRHLEDTGAKMQAEDNSALLNLGLRGWRKDDVDYCRRALQSTVKFKDSINLIRRYMIECNLYLLSAKYRECSMAADFLQQLAQKKGDSYSFTVFSSFGAISLLHLGAWRDLLRHINNSLTQTEKNANPHVSGHNRVLMAWLHAEAMDYKGAISKCEEVLHLSTANLSTYVLGRNVLAIACVGLGDFQGARIHFDEAIKQIDADGAMESVFFPYHCNNYCEYWIAVGDLAQAHEQAVRLYEIASAPPEGTYLALAHRLMATIAIAKGDFDQAGVELSRAQVIVESGDFPLAGWRVYETSALYYGLLGDNVRAADFQNRSERVIRTLASNFDQDEPLRTSLVSNWEARKKRRKPQPNN